MLTEEEMNRKIYELIRKVRFNEEFKIPIPEGGEDEQAFIGRCMTNLKDEFPNQDQRYAVCKKSWEDGI